MEKSLRVRKLEEIKHGEPFTSMEVWYKSDMRLMPVHIIPLDYLIYNVHNGRISSIIKSHKAQGLPEIDPATDTGKAKIESFLWKTNVQRNRTTLNDLEEHGQKKYGIVTQDGIIIDGNRRSVPTRAIYENLVVDDEWSETRETIIEQFHEDEASFRVIIANPQAVGESISLHKACHNALYLERDFNAGLFVQSKDRIHRYGLDRYDVTNYFYIVAAKTVEETIHRRLEEKVAAMYAVIESRDIPLIDLNLDYGIDIESDFKAVIRDYLNRSG